MSTYLFIILLIYLAVSLFNYSLEYLNISHMRKYGNTVPAEMEGHVDRALLSSIRDYTIERTRFGIVSSAINSIILLIFIFGGVLNAYNSWISSLGLSTIISGILFFLLLVYAEMVISAPFSLYRTFVIEKKYGFNKMTVSLWITDQFKSLFITSIMLSALLAGGLWIFESSPALWWLWLWIFFFVFSIFVMYISPYVLEPLFNKFVPLEDEALEVDISSVMSKVGIKVSKVFMMDASKRSTHTNAYFSGIGKVKRIVLFDTLLKMLDKNEILAVLAHEAGHWKRKHILKFILLTEAIALMAFYISFHLVSSDVLTIVFNIDIETVYVKAVLIGFLGSIALFPLTPLFHMFSRKHEKEADDFSTDITGDAEGMIMSLIKLSKDNLSNLHPHPLYSAFHYSHPPVIERIRRLKGSADPGLVSTDSTG